MAGYSNTDDLRREIQVLAAENEELKQLVQLLLENQDLKDVLRSQYSETASLTPLYESTQLDGQDQFGGQAVMLDSSSFAPQASFQLPVQQLSSPPVTPVGAGPVFMGQFPLRLDSTPLSAHTPQMFTPPPLTPGSVDIGQPPQAPYAPRMQHFQTPPLLQAAPVARLNLQSPPFQLRIQGSPDSGMQGPCLPAMVKWLRENKLKLSPEKTGAMLVGKAGALDRTAWPTLEEICENGHCFFHPATCFTLPRHPRGSSTAAPNPGGPGGTLAKGKKGAGFITPDNASQEFSFQGSSQGSRLGGRGYCVDCAVPFHPHIPQASLADSAMSGWSHQSSTSSDGSPQNFSSSSAVSESQRSAAAGSSYGPGSLPSSSHSPGSPLPPPAGATFSPAARPPYPPSPQDISAFSSRGQSLQSDYNSPHTPQKGYVPFSPNYMQSLSPSGFAYSPDNSQSPAGKVPPPSPGALTMEMLAPQSAAPYFTFPSSPQPTPPQSQARGTEVPQTPAEPKTKEHGEADRQATSVILKKPSKDSKHVTTERIVGEIAFQLDRRILSSIFPDRVRLYGFTVSNIPEKIKQNGSEAQTGLSEDQCKSMMERYNSIMSQLKPLGYDPSVHPRFTEQIVNTYGILRDRPDIRGTEGDMYNDIEYLRNVVQTTVSSEKCADCMMLLNCLHKLSLDDGKPLFIW